MTGNVEKDLAEKLKSSSTSEIYKTLVKIRKNYVRSHDKMKKLEKYSVIKSIIPFMEHPKFCNISLSIIADGCLELSFVNEVIKCDGPKALMRIMKSSVNDDIHNRACRALGNIAKFDIGFKAVLLMKPVSNIVNFLSETKDVNCQQTAVRTLMILGKSSKTRELIAQENGLIYIAKLLHSSDVQVLICSIKALANLTNNCSISCARQLLEFEFHKALVELHSHSEKSVRNHALISLKNLSFLEEIRSGLVKVGAVKLFTEVLSAYESHETSKNAALALCKCLDHIHMWSHNGTDRSVGLKALLAVLKNSHLQDIHIAVLTALIPLSFEFNVTDILLSLDVLQILIEILDSFIKRHECKTVGKLSYKYIGDEESLSSDHKLSNKVDQLKYLATSSSQKLLESDLPKDKNVNSFEYGFKDSGSPKKSHDVYKLHKWDSSLYGYSSVTSDYSGSCSPTGTCSPPMQKRSTSPGFSYDVDVGSPSTGHTSSGIWSPASLIDESTPYNVNCWSPVVSTHSSSPVREFELMEYDENEYIMKDEFSLVENFNSAILDIDTEENTLEMSVSSNSISLRSDTVEEIKLVSKLSKTNSYDDSKSIVPSKKLKTHHLPTDNPLELQFQTAVDINIKEIDSNSCLNLENIASCSHNLPQKNSAGIVSLDCSETVIDKDSKTKDACKSQVSESLQVKNSSAAVPSKKLKTHHLPTDNPLELQFQTAVDINIKEIDSNSCLNLENIASCSHNLPQKNSAGIVSLDCSETVIDKDSKTKDACKSQVSESLQVKNSSAAVPSKKLKTHHLPTDNPLELQFQTAVDINLKEIDSNSCLNLENIASCSHNLPQKNSAGIVSLDCSETVIDKDSKTKDACKSQVSESLQVKNSSAAVPSKKLKTHHLPTDNPLELQFQTAVDINIKEVDSNSCLNLENIASCSHNLPQKNSSGIISLGCSETVMDKYSKTKDACKSQVSESLQVKNSSAAAASSKSVSDDNEKPSDLKILTGTVDRPSIDRYVIIFILQISFHIEKRTNSHMAEKSFFSVLIDYLCLIHKPCLKAETVLSNLIRNRYCLEKLIVNGFFCELEEKMSAYEKILCSYHSHVSSVYSNLVNVGRQEMESDDYGIGILSRILITSDKKGQLHAICTLSKLVTEKISLYRLLIETKGLSLLLEFLSNSDDRIRRKAVLSLHEIYTSLTKKKKDPFKCCFGGTCAMGTSTKCFYKESFLNVTFVVGGGAKILANREKVCENSDYFQALLDGHFRESSSELVVFPHISAENLSAIFHFLHGCGNGSTCPYITRIPFSVLLELLSDSEKFLLTNIKTFVEDRLCHCLLSSQISKIYNQSKLHNSPALAKRALNEALRTVSSQKRLILTTFKELLDTASNVNVYSDIEELIKSLLL